MSLATALYETVLFIFESSVVGGATLREIMGLGDGVWATLVFTFVLCLLVSELLLVELYLRLHTDADHVLVPDHILTGMPDLGYSTWPWLFAFAIYQGVGSAFV